MAKKKAGGKVSQKAQRHGKRLGLKVSGGQKVKPGMILLRQRGTVFRSGNGVGVGRDHTFFALRDGRVKFTNKQSLFHRNKKREKIISVTV